MRYLILLLGLLGITLAGPLMLTACCTAACAIETPPVDGGVATSSFIAICTGSCLSTGGSVVGFAGPICVWAPFTWF